MGYTNLRGVDRVPVSLVRFVLKTPRYVARPSPGRSWSKPVSSPDLGYAAELLAGRALNGGVNAAGSASGASAALAFRRDNVRSVD
ncbi:MULTISPECIES: hypothetical protein [Mycobacteriaceae]|uniref:hypothetical protein n=1 Tax=Mycobacteriaceae TaxID=1762 RepID=UPI000A432897|nr:hypothetical protein [Mycolicibacterium senegalense]